MIRNHISGLPNCSFHEEFFYALVPTVMLLMKEVLHQSTSFTLCHYLVSFCKYGDMKGTNRKIIDLGKSSFLKDPLESSELMKASAKCIHNSRAACFYLGTRYFCSSTFKSVSLFLFFSLSLIIHILDFRA